MQPTTKGDKIFASKADVAVYRTSSISDAFSFIGIEPKKPLFNLDEEIGTYTGFRQSSRDVIWYSVSWIHKYRRISLGGTRLVPVIQYTDYTETREGWVRDSDVYAVKAIQSEPPQKAPVDNVNDPTNSEKDKTENGEPAPLESAASNSGGVVTTSKTLTTILYGTLSLVVTIFLIIIFKKPKNQQ
jgi:hypothetical protein